MSKTLVSFRDSPTTGVSRVDRESRTLVGVAVATKGEVRTHGLWLDDVSLQQIVALGNGRRVGIKSRFQHQASDDSLGAELGRFTNFRLEDDRVRADLRLLKSADKSPRGALGEYVMSLAEEDADIFGASMVFYMSDPEPAEQGSEQSYPSARLSSIVAVDLVGDPAANESLFSIAPDAAEQMLAAAEARHSNDEGAKAMSDAKQKEELSALQAEVESLRAAAPKAGDLVVSAEELAELHAFAETGKAAAEELRRVNAEHGYQDALTAGKLVPAQHQWAIAYALSDPDGFAAFCSCAPRVLHQQPVGGSAGPDHAARGNPHAEVTKLFQAKVSAGLQAGAAMDSIRRENPELFRAYTMALPKEVH